MVKLSDSDFAAFCDRVAGSASVSYRDALGSIPNPVPYEVYCMFYDTEDYLLREVVYHNHQKNFFKGLRKEVLGLDSLPALESLGTHLSLGYIRRMESRTDVNPSFYQRLRVNLSDVIETLIHKGEVRNPYYVILSEDVT